MKINSKKVVLFIDENHFGKTIRGILLKNKVPLVVYDINNDREARDFIMKDLGFSTFPVIGFSHNYTSSIDADNLTKIILDAKYGN